MCVAFPEHCPPETLLGPFLGLCQQRVGTADEILSQAGITELEALKDYGNWYHHDSNPAWQSAVVDNQELTGFCRAHLRFRAGNSPLNHPDKTRNSHQSR